MKSKKTASSRRRISFAVDRDEIEVNSDWVEAVMAAPNRRAAEPTDPPLAPAPVSREVLFFAPEPNNATDEVSAPGEQCSSVEITSSVAETAPVAQNTAVAHFASVDVNATGAENTTVAAY